MALMTSGGRGQPQTGGGAVAQAPDGSLYVGESQKGKVWRVMYTGR
jgi:glucose/arabinose dehydrogenase